MGFPQIVTSYAVKFWYSFCLLFYRMLNSRLNVQVLQCGLVVKQKMRINPRTVSKFSIPYTEGNMIVQSHLDQ